MLRHPVIAVVFLIALALVSVEVDAQPRTKIVIGYASMSSVATTLWVAQEKGFFTKNGLDAQSVAINVGEPGVFLSRRR